LKATVAFLFEIVLSPSLTVISSSLYHRCVVAKQSNQHNCLSEFSFKDLKIVDSKDENT